MNRFILILAISACSFSCGSKHHHSGGSAFDAGGFGHAYRDSVQAAIYCVDETYDELENEFFDDGEPIETETEAT